MEQAHDDFNIPDTVLSGYFDGMPIAIMAGQCWKALIQLLVSNLDLVALLLLVLEECEGTDGNDANNKDVLHRISRRGEFLEQWIELTPATNLPRPPTASIAPLKTSRTRLTRPVKKLTTIARTFSTAWKAV